MASDGIDPGRVLVWATVLVGAVVAVGLVASLAGFGGSGGTTNATTTGPGTGTGTTTPGTTAGGTTLEDLSAEDYPPGVTADSTNATNLATAHRRSLSGQSYEARLVRVQRVRTRNGTARSRLTQVVLVDGAGRLLTRVAQTGDGPSFRRDAFVNGSVAVERTIVRNNTNYKSVRGDRIRRRASGWLTIARVVDLGAFRPVRVLETGPDGPTLLLNATGLARDANSSAGDLRSFAGSVVVGPRGRVTEMNVSIRYVDERGRPVRVSFRYGLRNVGATDVTRPDWVPEALARTGG